MNTDTIQPDIRTLYYRRNNAFMLFFFILFLGIFAFTLLKFTITLSIIIIVSLAVSLAVFFNVGVGIIVLIIAMLFSPEFSMGTLEIFGFGKDVNLRMEDFLLIVLFFASLARIVVKRDYKILLISSPVNIPLLLFIGVCVISTMNGIKDGVVTQSAGLFYNLKLIEFYLIYFFVCYYVREVKQVRLCFYMLILVAIAVAIYVIPQIPNMDIWKRISAPFEGDPEPNTLAGFFVIILSFCFSFILYSPKGRRIIWFYIFTFIFIPFLYTLSRTGYLALVLAFLLMSILSNKKFVVFLIILFLLVSPFILPEKIKSRVTYTFERSDLYGIELSAAERIYALKAAVYSHQYKPLLGYGLTGRGFLDSSQALLILETGLLGFAIFWWLLIKIFLMAFYVFRKTDDYFFKAFSLGFITTLVGIIVHSFGSITFYTVRIMEPFWLLTGLMAVLYNLTLKRLAKQNVED